MDPRDDSPPPGPLGGRRKPKRRLIVVESDEEEEIDWPESPKNKRKPREEPSPPATQHDTPPFTPIMFEQAQPLPQESYSQSFKDAGVDDAFLLAAVEEIEQEQLQSQPTVRPTPRRYSSKDKAPSFGDAFAYDKSSDRVEQVEVGDAVFFGDRVAAAAKSAREKMKRDWEGSEAKLDKGFSEVLWERSRNPFICNFMVDTDAVHAMCDYDLPGHFEKNDPTKLAVHDKATGVTKTCKDYLTRSLLYFRDTADLSVTYRLDEKCGRMLVERPEETNSIMWPIYMKSSLRKIVMRGYRDIDIVNAHVTFTYLLCCTVMPRESFSFLECYYAHREHVLQSIMIASDISRDKAKQEMLVSMYGGRGETDNLFVSGFRNDLSRAVKLLKSRIKAYDPIGRALRKMFPKLPSESKENVSNPVAKDLSYINSRIESAIVFTAAGTQYGCVGALVYDGLLVKLSERQDIKDVLKGMEDKVYETYGWRVRFVEKSMEMTDKDWEWLNYPKLTKTLKALPEFWDGQEPSDSEDSVMGVVARGSYQKEKQKHLRLLDDDAEEEKSEEESEIPPTQPAPKKSPPRIAKKLTNGKGELHFTDPDLQQDQLEPKEDDGPTVTLKRLVLQAAQEQKLFRVYGGNGVFGVSERLPKRLELKYNTLFDFINSVGHDKACVIEADLTKIADDLKVKAVAPGVFPFMQLGDSVCDGMQVDFAFQPHTTRWSFIDGQLDISKLKPDPDGDEEAPNDVYYELDTINSADMKFYRCDVPEEAKYIEYTLMGIDAHWLPWTDEEGNERAGYSSAVLTDVPNFQRMIMTQITDTDFDPDNWWEEDREPSETKKDETMALLVVLALIGRFFMPNNTRDRWELFPFCFGESSVGKGSLVNTLREIINCPALVGELSSSSRKGLGSLVHFESRLYLFCVEAEKVHEHISIGDFKAMASSESVSFSQLYKGENKQLKWNKQMWFLGQEANALYTSDPAGAVGRRVAAMWFRRKHRLTNYSVEKGMKEEAGFLFSLAVQSYHYLRNKLEGVKLLEWQELPTYFKMSKEKMQEQLSVGQRFFTHTQTIETGEKVQYVPYLMQPEDKGQSGWVAWSTLKGDIEAFAKHDPVLKTSATNPLLENWLSEARASLRPLYEKVREKQIERGQTPWPAWDHNYIHDKQKYRCCKIHSDFKNKALIGQKYCGCVFNNANKHGSVVAVLNLHRLVGDHEIDEWFDKMGIESKG